MKISVVTMSHTSGPVAGAKAPVGSVAGNHWKYEEIKGKDAEVDAKVESFYEVLHGLRDVR